MTSKLYLWCRVRHVRQCVVTVFFGHSWDSFFFCTLVVCGTFGGLCVGTRFFGFESYGGLLRRQSARDHVGGNLCCCVVPLVGVVVDRFEGNRHVITSEAICAVLSLLMCRGGQPPWGHTGMGCGCEL
jgi:hypothetical protein